MDNPWHNLRQSVENAWTMSRICPQIVYAHKVQEHPKNFKNIFFPFLESRNHDPWKFAKKNVWNFFPSQTYTKTLGLWSIFPLLEAETNFSSSFLQWRPHFYEAIFYALSNGTRLYTVLRRTHKQIEWFVKVLQKTRPNLTQNHSLLTL